MSSYFVDEAVKAWKSYTDTMYGIPVTIVEPKITNWRKVIEDG